MYLFDSFLVDERSLGSSRGDAIPDLQILLHGSSQFLDKFIINTFVYINPVGTHTGLKEKEVVKLINSKGKVKIGISTFIMGILRIYIHLYDPEKTLIY